MSQGSTASRAFTQPRFILVSGIPRAGSSWMMRIVGSLLRAAGCAQPNRSAAAVGREDDYPTNARGDAEDLRLRAALAGFRAGGSSVRWAKTHYYPGSALTAGERFRVVWIWRDLRDVMASTCHYALAGPAREVFGQRSQEQAFDDVIRMTLPVAIDVLRHLDNTKPPESTLVVRYENLVENPGAGVEEISRHLGLALAGAALADIAAAHGFAREAGRAAGIEDRSSYHRIGTIGNWRDTLPERQQRLITSLAPDLDDLQRSLRARYG